MAHILITNDDGIHARGIRALAGAMRQLGRVTVVAPLSERSAASQSLTLRQPVYWETIAEGEHAVEGTPADAMIVAFTTMLKGADKPDLVVSGINRGGNLGENIHYSGTVGAVKEAAVHSTPGIAFSVVFRKLDIDYTPAAEFAKRLVPLVLKEGLPHGVVLNVNIPQEWNGETVAESYANAAAAGSRSARTALLLDIGREGCCRCCSRNGPCGDSRWRGVDNAAAFGPYGRGRAETHCGVGETARRMSIQSGQRIKRRSWRARYCW